MQYYKTVTDEGYIKAIGTISTFSKSEISEEEYNEILQAINNKPAVAAEGQMTRIKQTDTGFEYHVVEIPEESEAAASE